MDLDLAINKIRPTSQYLLNADHTAIVEWRDPNTAQPTGDELNAAWVQVQADLAAVAQAATADATEKATLTNVLTQLDTFIGLAAPTNLQIVAVVRLLAKIARFLLRRELARV